jgi:uncharacterized membrane protein
LSKLIALLMRVLLPLTLLVLLVYLAFIPFNFRRPFENRDVLIIYNAMLFAVVALLVGATPISLADLSPRLARWLRLAIIAVAALALIISLYALAAILYRTVIDRLTPNRLAFIGWNLVNIGLLALLLYKQFRGRPSDWLPGLHRAYSAGTVAYAVWTVIIILITPWLFGFNRAEVEKLPAAVQDIIYQFPDPVLLKCAPSPHIYLLDGPKSAGSTPSRPSRPAATSGLTSASFPAPTCRPFPPANPSRPVPARRPSLDDKCLRSAVARHSTAAAGLRPSHPTGTVWKTGPSKRGLTKSGPKLFDVEPI